MKLAAIFNVFDGIELLRYSYASIRAHVDLIVIVYQDISNFGEHFDPMPEIEAVTGEDQRVLWYKYIPPHNGGAENEIAKRNLGLKVAREHNCTHFFFQDVDECWEDMEGAKRAYVGSGSEGSVAPIYTYFRRPTWRLAEKDNYYVPFIHKLHSHTEAGWTNYPWYVDPTRRVACSDVCVLPQFMHHFSYVRADVERKCRNSSARENIQKSQLLSDYHNPAIAPGYRLKDFQNQALVETENLFNIETPWLKQ